MVDTPELAAAKRHLAAIVTDDSQKHGAAILAILERAQLREHQAAGRVLAVNRELVHYEGLLQVWRDKCERQATEIRQLQAQLAGAATAQQGDSL